MARNKSFELRALDGDGRGVRVTFAAVGPSYRQILSAVTGEEAFPLLESESTPWQEIVEHEQPDGRPSLLLTGAGDGNYWSATITPLTDFHMAVLGFDFACRPRHGVSPPSVAYDLAGGITATPRDGALMLSARDGRQFLLCAAETPTSLAAEGIATCRIVHARQTVSVEALGSPHVSTRKTVRWRYEISAVHQR
jgi:hypothetical protein